MLIINADDWGRDTETTDRIHECVKCRAISSVSAMVFMEDSERAAVIAQEQRISAGLHLNFTTKFTSSGVSSTLQDHQWRVSSFLSRRSWSLVVFHPGLVSSFDYLVKSQCDEFATLYGDYPQKLDGHHHMHLCANVLLQRLLPSGTAVRRSFSFRPKEKSMWNRMYRRLVDIDLARNHQLTDYFFSIAPLKHRERLDYIFSLAKHSVVELETHPVALDEYTYLTSGEVFRACRDVAIANTPGSVMEPAVNVRGSSAARELYLSE